MKRSSKVKTVLWILTGMAAAVAIARFTRGLGATTNLTDSTPWGFWIGFDVMAGVALAAGGFVMAAAVYIFRIEKFRPLLRATVLTAFLGYVAVAVGLLFDLGVPWNIWHPMVFWNHHSVLFEVAWCVMLYLTVLALEFAPAALEHKALQWGPLPKIYKLLKALTVPLVLLGIMLSTLHQSSLGSLFLIMPFRVHPLWYSPWLPLLFFISAIGLGFMMVALENFVSGWVYRHETRVDLLSQLGVAAAAVLGVYVVFRVGDLWNRNVLAAALDGSWQSIWFIGELAVSAVIPIVILSIRSLRENPRFLFLASAMVVIGMVFYRLDIAIITMARWPGTTYVPSLIEFMVSIGIVSGLALVFMFFVEHLKIFGEIHEEEEPRILDEASPEQAAANLEPPRGAVAGTVARLKDAWLHDYDPFQKPELSSQNRLWIGDPWKGAITKFSMIAVLGMAIAVAVIPSQAIEGFRYQADPVEPARLMPDGETLKIDGNRMAEAVYFNHEDHKERLGGKDGCARCHHMNLPEAFASPCAECHADMYKEVSAFDHEFHKEWYGGNDGCVRCHPVDKNPENAASCVSCHEDMYPEAVPGQKVNFMAPAYMDAMHEKCATCHEEKAAEQNRGELGLCTSCHWMRASE